MEALSSYTEPEEGEILNDDPNELYVPLERPHVPSTVLHSRPSAESDDDHDLRESSSDSDSTSNPSKVRKKFPEFKPSEPFKKKKNYNIWCEDLQAEVLTNSLVDCNVDKLKKRTRDVESYDYKLYNDNNMAKDSHLNFRNANRNRFLRKRRHDGVCMTSYENNSEIEESKKNELVSANSRNILNLNTSVNNSNEEIATDIANKLCEEKQDLILSALNILGKEAVISLFEETREIERTGGMLVMNGTRRRTPGGVFFYLLKTSETLPRDKVTLVLSEDKKAKADEKKSKAKMKKQIQAAKFKEALSKDDFPVLLSRTQLAIQEFKAKKLAEDSGEVTNPPPSPATDGKDCSSDGEEQQKEGGGSSNSKTSIEGRTLTTYDSSIFGNEDTMEVF